MQLNYDIIIMSCTQGRKSKCSGIALLKVYSPKSQTILAEKTITAENFLARKSFRISSGSFRLNWTVKSKELWA